MVRRLKILVVSLVVVGLMAGSAFAGTTKVNYGAPNAAMTVALEALTAARNVTINGVAGNNGPIAFMVSQNVTSANFVSVIFTGAAFGGDTVRICKSVAAGNIIDWAVASPSQDSTSYNFQIQDRASGNLFFAGDTLYLTTDAACTGTGANNMNIKLAATTATSPVTVAISIVSAGNIPVDPSSTATIATVGREYTAAFNAASTHTVDYLGTPGDGTRFSYNAASNNNAGSNSIVRLVRTVKNYGAINGTALGGAANGAGLTVSGFVTLSDAAGWSGVSKLFINTGTSGANCVDAAASNMIGRAAPTGTVTLALPVAAYNGISRSGDAATVTTNDIPVDVCVVANGTTALSPRTISVSGAINATGTSGTVSASTTFDTWGLNAYQTWVSWMINSAQAPTYCLVNNGDAARTATVLLDVTSSEGSTTTLANINLGTVAARTSKMVTITADSVQMAGGTAQSLVDLGANARYAPKLTVTANPANVNVQCIQTDPITGAKRNVNNLQNGGTWTF